MKRFLPLFGVVCCLLLLNACKKELSDDTSPNAILEIKIVSEINGQPLQLNKPFQNTFNEDFVLTDYKYYLSNFELLNPVRSVTSSNSCFLIDAKKPSSYTFKTLIKADTYNSLSFIIGIDSLRTISDGQTGVLDTAQGMFWSKNAGYIMAKLEGKSTQSGAPGNLIRHHIGGFERAHNALRQVLIPLNAPVTLEANQTLQVELRAELLRWFDGFHEMKIADNPSIMAPGHDAMRIADNYSNQFSLSSITIK